MRCAGRKGQPGRVEGVVPEKAADKDGWEPGLGGAMRAAHGGGGIPHTPAGEQSHCRHTRPGASWLMSHSSVKPFLTVWRSSSCIDGNGKAGVAILARADLRIHSPAEAKVGQGRMEGSDASIGGADAPRDGAASPPGEICPQTKAEAMWCLSQAEKHQAELQWIGKI